MIIPYDPSPIHVPYWTGGAEFAARVVSTDTSDAWTGRGELTQGGISSSIAGSSDIECAGPECAASNEHCRSKHGEDAYDAGGTTLRFELVVCICETGDSVACRAASDSLLAKPLLLGNSHVAGYPAILGTDTPSKGMPGMPDITGVGVPDANAPILSTFAPSQQELCLGTVDDIAPASNGTLTTLCRFAPGSNIGKTPPRCATEAPSHLALTDIMPSWLTRPTPTQATTGDVDVLSSVPAYWESWC